MWQWQTVVYNDNQINKDQTVCRSVKWPPGAEVFRGAAESSHPQVDIGLDTGGLYPSLPSCDMDALYGCPLWGHCTNRQISARISLLIGPDSRHLQRYRSRLRVGWLTQSSGWMRLFSLDLDGTHRKIRKAPSHFFLSTSPNCHTLSSFKACSEAFSIWKFWPLHQNWLGFHVGVILDVHCRFRTTAGTLEQRQRRRLASMICKNSRFSMGIPGSNWWRYVSTIFQAIFSGDIPWN